MNITVIPAQPPTAAPVAYIATVVPFDLQHPTLRRLRLSEPQATALAGLTAIPIAIDGASKVTPCAQAETALQAAATEALGRETCAVLYRWSNGGELWVLCCGPTFVKVATVELTPARTEVAAA